VTWHFGHVHVEISVATSRTIFRSSGFVTGCDVRISGTSRAVATAARGAEGIRAGEGRPAGAAFASFVVGRNPPTGFGSGRGVRTGPGDSPDVATDPKVDVGFTVVGMDSVGAAATIGCATTAG